MAGWFNSPFEYEAFGVLPGDAATWDRDDAKTLGGRQTLAGMAAVADWAKRGTSVIRAGDLPRKALDALHAVGVYVMLSPSGGVWNLTRTLESVRALRDHPAVLGYYLCDDCCKGSDFTLRVQRARAPGQGT